ncbi:MAG: hypothetical protein OK404_02930 [Thaumarchaeota archaeon]|nr:hypothetical protein [Nitrososphaerota archaeon]
MSNLNTFGLPGDLAGQVRRSPMEMVCDILGVVSQGPTKPTHILYKANMSWKVLSSYLEFLTDKGMVEKKEDEGGKRSTYHLTGKGRTILHLYDGLRESLKGALTPEASRQLNQLAENLPTGALRASGLQW